MLMLMLMLRAKKGGQRERLGFSTFTVLFETKKEEDTRGEESSKHEKRDYQGGIS